MVWKQNTTSFNGISFHTLTIHRESREVYHRMEVRLAEPAGFLQDAGEEEQLLISSFSLPCFQKKIALLLNSVPTSPTIFSFSTAALISVYLSQRSTRQSTILFPSHVFCLTQFLWIPNTAPRKNREQGCEIGH